MNVTGVTQAHDFIRAGWGSGAARINLHRMGQVGRKSTTSAAPGKLIRAGKERIRAVGRGVRAAVGRVSGG